MEITTENEFSLERINACLDQRGLRTSFPADLERAFSAHVLHRNNSVYGREFWLIAVIYNLFLTADFLILPETAYFSAFLHIFVVSPGMLILNKISATTRSLRMQELSASMVALLIFLQIIWVFWIDNTDARSHYQTLACLVPIFYNVGRPVSFAVAQVTNAIMVSIFAIAMLTSSLPVDIVIVGLSMMLATVYATLKANLRLERDSRDLFLHRLQDKARYRLVERDAKFDALTGLHNRRYLDEFITSHRDAQTEMGVIMADIDHFKRFNDHFGHQAGDECLRKVADVLSSQTRGGSGSVFRYGGEEFLVLLPGANLYTTHKAAERLRSAVEALAIEAHATGESRVVTASFGVACGLATPDLFPELLRGADAALYAAKHDGRNRVWPHLPTTTGVEGVRKSAR